MNGRLTVIDAQLYDFVDAAVDKFGNLIFQLLMTGWADDQSASRDRLRSDARLENG
jgi:hypothetical protein